jgi:hypothetical protein
MLHPSSMLKSKSSKKLVRIRQQAEMKQIIECMLAEMKTNQEETMAKVGVEMKADMKKTKKGW